MSCPNLPAGRRSRTEPKEVLGGHWGGHWGGHRPPGRSARIEGSVTTETWLEPTLPPEMEELRAALLARIVGQEEAVDYIVRAMSRYRAKLAGLERPVAAFLLLGPTGVGKTSTVEALADLLHGSPKAVLKIHCSEFCSDHELARMKGAPPGYVGWRECVPLFHEARLKEVRARSDLALVLFDEVEKAHPTLWDLLLGLLDKGEVVLNDNTRTDFRKTLVFLTGNAGGREVAQALSGGAEIYAWVARTLRQHGYSRHAAAVSGQGFASDRGLRRRSLGAGYGASRGSGRMIEQFPFRVRGFQPCAAPSGCSHRSSATGSQPLSPTSLSAGRNCCASAAWNWPGWRHACAPANPIG